MELTAKEGAPPVVPQSKRHREEVVLASPDHSRKSGTEMIACLTPAVAPIAANHTKSNGRPLSPHLLLK